MTQMVRLALMLLSSGVGLLGGCVHIGTSTDHREMSQTLLWYRTSANQKSLFMQAFKLARLQAVAFAPAREFIAWVRSQGGRVIAVTNRSQSQCTVTRRNLESQGVSVDGLLCAPDGVLMPEKESRFNGIENGTALPDLGALQVLLYIGDQVADCRGQSEEKYDVTLYRGR